MSRLEDARADIQQRVERRRLAGDYPPDLAQRLAAHVSDTSGSPAGEPPVDSAGDWADDSAALEAALEALHAARRFDADRIPTSSRSRAGEAAHRALNVALGRQTAGILAQVSDFAEQVETALRVVAARLEGARLDGAGLPRTPVLLAAQLEAVLDRVAELEQPLAPMAGLADVRRRVEALESVRRIPDSGTWWDSRRWVEALDGPFDQVVALRAALAATLEGPVLDLSCRRGELLWALRDREIPASGADADSRLAATAAGAGLSVAHAGPLVTLARAEDGSLGAVAALGVAGRLGSQGAADLVALAAEKLRFGGRLVIELAEVDRANAYADPTAGMPIPAEWIRFACAEVRFSQIVVERGDETPAGARPGCYLVTATK